MSAFTPFFQCNRMWIRAFFLLFSGWLTVLFIIGCESRPASEYPDAGIGTTSLERKDGAYLLTWSTLATVRFEENFDDSLQISLQKAIFPDPLRQLNGQQVRLRGYLFPLEDSLYVLSAKPFANCFFCGQAGPETVVELEPASYPLPYSMDDFLMFEGKLVLNNDDQNRLYFLLLGATPVR